MDLPSEDDSSSSPPIASDSKQPWWYAINKSNNNNNNDHHHENATDDLDELPTEPCRYAPNCTRETVEHWKKWLHVGQKAPEGVVLSFTSKGKTVCRHWLAGYCRSSNLKYLDSCQYLHLNKDLVPTHHARFKLLDVPRAKSDEVERNLKATWKKGVTPTFLKVEQVENPALEALWNAKKSALEQTSFPVLSLELWHGTLLQAIPQVLRHGLLPPADFQISSTCPKMQKRGLAALNRPSFCNNSCTHCKQKHKWKQCHMFGLGIYFADCSSKSDTYVTGVQSDNIRKLLLCQVLLGKVYEVKTLSQEDAMHDCVRAPKGSDTIHAIATKSSSTSVGTSEYIVFHPYQVMPRYVVTYKA